VRHGQGDLLADLGGAQVQAQLAHLGLQFRHPRVGAGPAGNRPAARARLQAVQGALQQPAAQVVEAPLGEPQGQGALGHRPPAGQGVQEHPQPGLGLGRAVQPLDQPGRFELTSSRHEKEPPGRKRKPGGQTLPARRTAFPL
jgi:hypothetical protein